MSNQLNPVLIILAAVHPMRPVTQWTTMPATVATTFHQSTSMCTLYFMCGPEIHNCTQHMDISDLQSFTMAGLSIYMPIPMKVPNDPKNSGNRTYRFANVSILRIENAKIFFISLDFIGNIANLTYNM